MRIAYCDDEPVQLEYVKHLAEQWAIETKEKVQVELYQSAQELLFKNPETYPFDLLILDIDMDGMDGMSLARKIREKDERIPIIFLTNRREYVFEGYEVQALRYLLKPMNAEKLHPLLEEIWAKAGKHRPFLVENISGENTKLYIEEILYVEADGHYLHIHMKEKDYEIKKTLAELERKLREAAPEAGFISTHRSYLVNTAQIEQVRRTDCVLSDGSVVPVSRNSYKAVNEAFIRENR